MTFIASSEANNVYFMSGEAMNEIYFFLASLDEINGIFTTKKWIFFLFRDRCFALYNVWRRTRSPITLY